MAPVVKVGVLTLAEIAHGKVDHRRVVPVVRDSVYDRVPRSAELTAYEWMQIARIVLVVELSQAVGADGQIGRNHRRSAATTQR